MTTQIGNFAVFKDRATRLWIVRDTEARADIAHEASKADAIKVARAKLPAKLTQGAVFAEIRALGLVVRKTEFGDIRVADASELNLAKREEGAAYCSDLQEALDTARHWHASRKAAPAPAPARQTIDITPTWAAMVPVFRMLIENGDAKGRATAWDEITRMAALADERNAMARGNA